MANGDEYDEDEESEGRPRRGSRGKGGERVSRKSKPQIDLFAEDQKSRGWDFLRSAVAMKANDLGRWAGDEGFAKKLLDKLDQTLGTTVTGDILFPGLAAILNQPQFVKNAIRAAGLPPQLNHIIEDGIDDLLEGLRQSRRDRGRVSPEDAAGVDRGSNAKFAMLLSSAFTYQQCLGMLSIEEQTQFTNRLAGIGEDRQTIFEGYKLRINTPRDLRVLLNLPDDQWILHLKQRYRDLKPPASQGIATTIEAIAGTVDRVARKIFAPPATGPDPVVEAIKKARASTKKRRFHV